MNRTIVVSDLHLDTWTDRKLRSTGKSRKEHFFELLEWCEQAPVRELVINGDLMDLPPPVPPQGWGGQGGRGECFPEGPSIAREVIERLLRFATWIPVTYVFGNHDIGVSGFRSMGRNSIGWRCCQSCVPARRAWATPDSVQMAGPRGTRNVEARSKGIRATGGAPP